jgi:hypothetical protein
MINSPVINETARRILEYICSLQPADRQAPVFQSRRDITGMLRLSLSEYDEACRRLDAAHLIISDQPGSGDLDFIAPTQEGFRYLSGPTLPVN